MPLTVRLVAALALAACATPLPQTTTSSASPAPAIDPARLATHVRVLASDEFLGRGPATPGETKTVEYIAAQLRAAGVQPGGPNGSWYQEVPLNQSDIVDRKSTRLNSSHANISYAVFCLKKKKTTPYH